MTERRDRPDYNLIKTSKEGEKYCALNSNTRFGANSPEKLGELVARHAGPVIDGINFHTFTDEEMRGFFNGFINYQSE